VSSGPHAAAPTASTEKGLPPDRLGRLSRAEGWHFWFVGRRALVDELLRRHVPADGRPLLDVGCGTGFQLRALSAQGYRMVGIDLRPEGLLETRAGMPGARLLRGSATKLPVTDDSVGGVLLLDVLEHVDDGAALAEVRRVLHPGGTAVITVPAFPFLWSHRDEAAGHLRRYTRRGLSRAVALAGIELIEMRFYQFLLFPLVLLSRLAGRWSAATERVEEGPGRALNALLTRIALLDASLGRIIPWPWGSSLVAVCRKPLR
jgi:SAM-dependent methyltransferase